MGDLARLVDTECAEKAQNAFCVLAAKVKRVAERESGSRKTEPETGKRNRKTEPETGKRIRKPDTGRNDQYRPGTTVPAPSVPGAMVLRTSSFCSSMVVLFSLMERMSSTM